MSDSPPSSERLEGRLAYIVNVIMATAVGLVFVFGPLWLAFSNDPLALEMSGRDPGALPRHLFGFLSLPVVTLAVLGKLWTSVWRKWRSERSRQP